MKAPSGPWHVVSRVDSTQTLAAELLRNGDPAGIVRADEQTAGVGRFKRSWFSPPGTCLAMTLILREYADHPQPQFLGMGVALAAAAALRCQVSWPNDLMVGPKKLGGILTELVTDNEGRRIPLVGIGVNLGIDAFPPEISERATSLKLAFGGEHDPQKTGEKIVKKLAELPEPDGFAALAEIWNVFDNTPGKRYVLPNGQEAVAIGVGADGRLICSVDGESHTVLAAEAMFG